MLVGWRMGEDFAKLANLGTGILIFNILEGTCHFGEKTIDDLYISKEIQSWFSHRLTEHKIPIEEIKEATLKAEVTTEIIEKKNRKKVIFNWTCNSLIRTNEATYEGALSEVHQWN